MQVSKFGSEVPIGRPGQPKEFCAPAVFLACEDSSYVVGAILGVTGGGLLSSPSLGTLFIDNLLCIFCDYADYVSMLPMGFGNTGCCKSIPCKPVGIDGSVTW